MLTLKQIRDDKEAAVRRLAKKGVDAASAIEKIIALDDRRKAIQVELDTTLAAQNKAAKEIGALMGQGRREEAEERKHFVADLKEKSSRLQAESNDVQQELRIACGGKLNLQIEICSITNPQTMELTLHGNCSTGRDCTGMQPRLGKRINVRRLWICGF